MEKTCILDLSDLVSNLFLILMKNNIDVDKVTFEQIGQFKKILEEEAKKREMKLSFRLSRDETIKFFNYNRYTFDRKDDDSIVIKEGVTPYHLIDDYTSSLPLVVTVLISTDEVTEKTLNMMGYEKIEENNLESVDYYINELKESINNYASKMEFEKCIELRSKLHSLQRIQGYINSYKEEVNEKQKVISLKKQEKIKE